MRPQAAGRRAVTNERFDIDRARGVPAGGKTTGASGLRFVGVDGEPLVRQPARVAHVVRAPSERAPVPPVDQIEDKGGVHTNGGVQGGRRFPRSVAHSGDVTTWSTSGVQRDGYAVARHQVAVDREPFDAHLETLDRRVHIASGARGAHLFPKDRPWFDGGAKFEGHAVDLDRAKAREAELEERRHPGGVETKAVPGEIVDHLCNVGGHVPGKEEPVMELGPPAHQWGGVGGGPQAGDQGPHQ